MDNVTFRDLPADRFPFVVEYWLPSGEVVHRTEVTGPGVLEVPGLGHLGPVGVRVSYATGEVVELSPEEASG